MKSIRPICKRTYLLVLLLIGLAVQYDNPVYADYTTTPNPGTNWGTWQGWGCSLCWWANQYGTNTNMADVLFTLNNPIPFYSDAGTYNLPGLGMNVARYNVGGTSASPIIVDGVTYSPVNPSSLPAFKMIQNYWLDWGSSYPASASWDWSRDANQRYMMQLAKARGANIFQLFSNSPPWWMCYNHSTAGGANSGDNLQSWNYNQFAAYMAAVARYAYDNWGITFQTVEPFNEPIANWWGYPGTQECCHFDVATQDTVIQSLRTELNNRGLSWMPIASSDESLYDQALNTWNSLSSTSRSYTYQIDTHGYQYGGGRRDLLYTAAVTAGKALWNSEYGEGDATGMSLASNLSLDMRWLHPTVWCYWQPFDSGGWGMVQCNPGDNWCGSANSKWFVMAQYSRHIRPGMTIIDGGEGNTVSAYDPVNKKLVLVTANYGTAQWINYNLSNFATTGGPVTRWMTNTDGGDMYTVHNDTGLNGKTFSAWFPTNTVQTFEIQHVDPVNADTTAPVTTASGVTAGAVVNSNAVITLSATDNLAGVANTYYTIDTGLQQLYTTSFTVLGNGTHTVTYWSVDNTGNTEAANTISFTIAIPPTISSLSPSYVAVNSGDFLLTINGTGFESTSTFAFGGATNLKPTIVSSTQMTVTIPNMYINYTKTVNVKVTSSGGSVTSLFTVVQLNPVPIINLISPSSVVVNSGSFTLTINGSGFNANTIVSFGGLSNCPHTLANAYQITVPISNIYINYTKTVTVKVTNPAPGGGSASITFSVIAAANPVPTVTSLSPASVKVNSGNFTLTINGTNFIPGTTVDFGGLTNLKPTFVNATQLTLPIANTYLNYAKTVTVKVKNPTPGGGSASAQFMVTN